ncbi:ATP-binding protein [Streptomyces kebangsaanensis]|uniref:ATP-binding protein n=1 Tax=Streptomyces kebangsaanensis TaxID=864058 RepID=UPI00093FD030|nr:ATP-binding protein [Streptomyces kebangsaanensis]
MTAASPTATGVPGYSETVPCEPESAHKARLLVSAALSAWGITELTEAGTLIVSELLTNAINHTRSRMARVIVRRVANDRVRIGVADTSPDVPEVGRPSEEAEEGRGLLLVNTLSDRWGYDVKGRGKGTYKVVWAELLVEERA